MYKFKQSTNLYDIHTFFNKKNTFINKKINIKSIDSDFYKNKAYTILFFKKKFGLYKNLDFLNKRLKQKILDLSFYNKNMDLFDNRETVKKNKIIFYKKLNRLYYRAGRRILSKYLNFKKYSIQKNTTKKINNLIKKNWLNIFQKKTIINVLLMCGIFYTINDSIKYTKYFGVVIDNKVFYTTKTDFSCGIFFNLISSIFLLKFLKKKKLKLKFIIKKVKLYKFRIKKTIFRQKFKWITFNKWFVENSLHFYNRTSNVEFSIKTFSGVYLYKNNSIDFIDYFNKLNLSMYMSRSYNWKFLT